MNTSNQNSDFDSMNQQNFISSAFSSTIGSNKYVKNVASGVTNTASTVSTIAAKLTFLDKLKGLPIRTQILSGAGIALLFLVFVTTITFFSVGDLVKTSENIEQNSIVISESQKLRSLLSDMDLSLTQFAMIGAGTTLDNYAKATLNFDSTINKLTVLVGNNPEQIQKLKTLQSTKQDWVRLHAEPIVTMRKLVSMNVKSFDEFTTFVAQLETQNMSSMQTLTAEFIAKEEQNNRDKIKTAKIVSLATKSSAITFTIIALCAAIFVLLIVSKNIAEPVRELAKAAVEVVKGNLNVSVDILAKNELGILARNFNMMVASISNGIDELNVEKESVEAKVRQAVAEVEEQREYLSDSVDTMLKAMHEFASGDLTIRLEESKDDAIGHLFRGFNQAVENIQKLMVQVIAAVSTTADAASDISTAAEELSVNAGQQKQQTKEVATQVTNVALATEKNASSANTARTIADTSAQAAEDGSKIVTATVGKIERIADVVQSSAQTVEQLGRSSEEIGEILAVINKIADQTNLLALNAAIEAARAGEHGRGFAVVADEVRLLAEGTAKATKQISAIIHRIQSETNNAVRTIQSGKTEVQLGIEYAQKANSALTEILDSSHQVSTVVQEIVKATESQASTSLYTSDRIQEMLFATSASVTGIEQIARAANNLNSLTQDLNKLVNHFTIREEAQSQAKVVHIHHLVSAKSEQTSSRLLSI